MSTTADPKAHVLDDRAIIPRWVPAPHGPLTAVEVRQPGTAGPHWDGVRAGLVAGAGGAKEDFTPLMYRLAAAGYRGFAFDQCGQNETPGHDDPEAYSLASLALDLNVALTAACARRLPHLVGHGAGALVAASAVVARPDHYRSLTLLSPGWDAGAEHDTRADDWEAYLGAQHRAGSLTEERRTVIRQRLERTHPTGLRSLAAAVPDPDLFTRLVATGVPVLVMRGAQDTLVPSARTEELALQLGARHSVIARAGHLTHYDNPDAVAKALAVFWEGTDA
ncbi:alpha/beta fold hydrolase [Streptomyces melanogenes]|uniref:alpha/beta fold hydrolase n=1 Tax=Streptomyces melanogenes TaxID=67326 RepID=UPI00167EC976|nr:alpha/beta fold hydrolase [Streptomyces melanogenes]GGP92445.1 alpha/beta hydrolase [Streptomyces melanogenes]